MIRLRLLAFVFLLLGCSGGSNPAGSAVNKLDRPDAEPARVQSALQKYEGPHAGQERDDNGLKMRFVWCPPGDFTMGSPPAELAYSGEHNEYETQESVTLTKGVWLGKAEVTQSQWQGIMGTTPWKGKYFVHEGDNYPATSISWDDAKAFCKKLSEMENREYRLPTEAEWEYACRCGQKMRFGFGDNDSQLGDYAWYRANTIDVDEVFAHEVGQKKANSWGLHDMHGNVWEWCEDTFAEKLPGGIDPLVTDKDAEHVRRGASISHISIICRCAFRDKSPPLAHFDLGFRIALSPSQ